MTGTSTRIIGLQKNEHASEAPLRKPNLQSRTKKPRNITLDAKQRARLLEPKTQTLTEEGPTYSLHGASFFWPLAMVVFRIP